MASTLLASLGCAALGDERANVLTIASEHLDCRTEPLIPRVDDEEAPVRHWYASCDHRSVRITCAHEGCSQELERPRLMCDMPVHFPADEKKSKFQEAVPATSSSGIGASPPGVDSAKNANVPR